MDTSTSALLTGVIVTAGQWSNGKGVTARVILGSCFLALVLSVLSEANEKLAKQFGLVILVTAVLHYGVSVTDSMGLTNTKKKK